jgi:tetratricopeptide (TPR) repeat protein
MAIAVFTTQTAPRLFNPQPTPNELLPSPSVEPFMLPGNFGQVNLQTADVATLEAIASHYFRKQDLPKAEAAFNALLDRGALQAADTAFKAVSVDSLSEPSISFLRGKLAWLAVKQGNPETYEVTDAQRYWETAIKQQPDSVPYHNALGFAYYAQGKSKQALKEWCSSIALLTGNSAASNSAATKTLDTSDLDCAMPTQPITNPEAITAYAGIALALQQAVTDPDYTSQQKELLSRATQLHQSVVQSNPASVEPDELGKTWLWNEQAIRDWQTLGTL